MTRVLWLVVLVCVVQCSAMSPDELEDFSNFLLKTSSLDLHVKKGADPDDAFDDGELVSEHAWEESGKFEGDLILNDRQRRLIVENVEGLSRNGLTDSTKRWPNNEVIYFIQREHFNGGQVQAIEAGIEDLGQASCVKFRPYRKGDRDAVVIQGSRRGCFSQVGYQGGFQVLNLSGRHPVGRGCFRHGTVVHELLHTLGFYHMQSSPDRDDYIDVVWANIVQPARHNFRKYNSFSVSDFGVGYDYDSVLHYSRRAFSSNGQDTLVPKMSGAEIGQRVGLSDKDTQKLNKMYCDANNDHVQADETLTLKPKIKKKKPKNQPFQGHGIGYHQGKTVVIKLPAAQAVSLPNVPSIHMFDFSTTPQVSTPEARGYRFGKEVTHPHEPTISLNTETIKAYQNSYEVETITNKNLEKERPISDDKVESLEQSSKEDNSESSLFQQSDDSNEAKPDYIDKYDKDLAEALYRLSKIVKQHVYPQNQGVYKIPINKDYSKFFKPKKSHYNQDSLVKKIQTTYDFPVPKSQKQLDEKPGTHELHENPDDQLNHSHLEDRMDISYRTALPTKKPYSSYKQTETPQYATLEYLKNRNNFSDIYSPKTSEDYKHKDIRPPEPVTFKEDSIKISPYDKEFYTDSVKEDDSTGRVTDASKTQSINKQVRPSRYEHAESSTGTQFEDTMDSSYRTLLPIKKPYSAYEQTETPNYATLEYLKNRHDFNSLYTPKRSDVENQRKERYTFLGGNLPPTEADWYKKDSYKRHPTDYDQDFYSDYKQEKRDEHNRKGENNKHLTDATPYDDDDDENDDYDSDEDENSSESRNKTQETNDKETFDEDFYTDYEKENKKRLADGSKYNNDKSGAKFLKEIQTGGQYNYDHIDNEQFDRENTNKDEDGDKPPKKNKSKHEVTKHGYDHNTDYEKEHRSRFLDASNVDGDDNDNTKSLKTSRAYTLYDEPVPLTKNWYKPVPEITHDRNIRTLYDNR